MYVQARSKSLVAPCYPSFVLLREISTVVQTRNVTVGIESLVAQTLSFSRSASREHVNLHNNETVGMHCISTVTKLLVITALKHRPSVPKRCTRKFEPSSHDGIRVFPSVKSLGTMLLLYMPRTHQIGAKGHHDRPCGTLLRNTTTLPPS